MALPINVNISIPEQVSHRSALPLLFKFGSTAVFNLSRSSNMSSLEFPAYGSKSDHERIWSYISCDDPGDEGNPKVAGVDLCSNCRILRWLGLRRPSKEVHDFRYQESAGKPVSSTCELCQAICASFPSATQVRKITLSLGRLANAICTNKLWLYQERPYDLLFIDIEDKTGCTVTQGTAFSLTLSAQKEGVTVRQIEPKSVDYTEVRLWIDHCDSTHGPSCHTATKLDVPGFKVIDCFNRKVVPLPDLQTQYVALSYVWGKPNPKIDNSERFPQTIEDSIDVTLRLGYRYLWVDRYCIDQNDKDNKHMQVSMMDLIYSQAYLTIVAATGDAYDGLPGVNDLSRRVQKHFAIGHMRFDEWLVPHERVLKSNWITRAWTYQEGALSKRRMFFTDVGVAFWCQQMYCQESVRERPLPSDQTDTSNAGMRLEIIIPRVRDGIRKPNPGQVITQYSGKIMSSDSDALNACLGVLRALNTTHCWGIAVESNPCYPEHSRMHLAWINMGPRNEREERKEFPTWSWTRWAGVKLYQDFSNPRYHYGNLKIEIFMGDLQWLDVFDQSHRLRGLGGSKLGKILRVTGNIITPHYDETSEGLKMILTTESGFDLHLRTFIDSIEWDWKYLADTVALEIHRFFRYYTQDLFGAVLILKPDGDKYRRIAVAGYVLNERNSLTSPHCAQIELGPLAMAGAITRTVHIV